MKRIDRKKAIDLPKVETGGDPKIGGDETVGTGDEFTTQQDPKAPNAGQPNDLGGGGIQGGTPAGPWSVSVPASAKAIQASARANGVTTDKNCYRRSEASSVDENYYLNAMEAQVRFSQWLDGLGTGPIDVDAMMSTFADIHHVAALGESGNRRYLNLTDRMLKMYRPGKIRSDELMSRATGSRPDAARYANLVLGALGLEGRSEGPVEFPGVPLDENAARLGKGCSAYLYPTGGRERLRPFFVVAADKLERIMSGSDDAVLERIGEYYHALVSAKPFEQINNSLLMGNVNTLLERFGFEPVPHGYIDHLAYRTDNETFGKVFRAYVEGRVKSAPDYDLYLEG